MLVSKVRMLTPEQRLLYWVRERHSIFIKKELRQPAPWTNDEVLRKAFFTNPFRENDKVTRWFKSNIRDKFSDDPAASLFSIVAFRFFNLPETAEVFMAGSNLYESWDCAEAKDRLSKVGDKMFTGAYMIVMPCEKGGKYKTVCDVLDQVWKDRVKTSERIVREATLSSAHRTMMQYKGVGDFTAYEMISDMRHTSLLNHAKDIMTWCNLGPGATWGYHRVSGRVTGLVEVDKTIKKRVMRPEPPPLPNDYQKELQRLLHMVIDVNEMPEFEMRDLEHSLCEFDKYERYRLGAKPRRNYKGY